MEKSNLRELAEKIIDITNNAENDYDALDEVVTLLELGIIDDKVTA